MAKQRDEKKRQAEIDDRAARREKASPEELKDINESQGDGGNPDWWKNQGKPGEVH